MQPAVEAPKLRLQRHQVCVGDFAAGILCGTCDGLLRGPDQAFLERFELPVYGGPVLGILDRYAARVFALEQSIRVDRFRCGLALAGGQTGKTPCLRATGGRRRVS